MASSRNESTTTSADEQRQLGGEHPGEVDEDGRVPAHVDADPGAGDGRRDGRLSQVVDQVGGGRVLRGRVVG